VIAAMRACGKAGWLLTVFCMMAFQSNTTSALPAAGSSVSASAAQYGFQSWLVFNVYTYAFRMVSAKGSADS
jgi:hypothetical protein